MSVPIKQEGQAYGFHHLEYEANDLVRDAVKNSVDRHKRFFDAMGVWAALLKEKKARIDRVKRFAQLLQQPTSQHLRD